MGQVRSAATLAAFFLTAGFSIASPALAQNCQLVKMASFDLSAQSEDRVTIPIEVNGTKEPFLVDTGGAFSIISSTVVEAQHLTPRRTAGVELYAADGTVLSQYVKVETLGIGPLRASNVKMVIAPGESGGILAPDLLRNFDLDFDFAGNVLNLFSPDHCPGRVVYWSASYATVPFKMTQWDDHIQVPVTLDGHDFMAIVDTGASHTLLSAEIAHNVFGLDDGSPGMERIPGAGADSLLQYRYRFKSLTLDGIAVNNPQIAILPDAAAAAFKKRSNEQKMDNDPIYGIEFKGPRVILGMDVLSKLHFYIAYGEKTLYVTAADAGHPSPAVPPAAAATPASPK